MVLRLIFNANTHPRRAFVEFDAMLRPRCTNFSQACRKFPDLVEGKRKTPPARNQVSAAQEDAAPESCRASPDYPKQERFNFYEC